jgi:hypothetical protein
MKTWNFRLDEKDSQVLDDFLKKSKEELRAVNTFIYLIKV